MDVSDSPLDLFWFFVPKELFQKMADESNRYATQTVNARARRIRNKQKASKRYGRRDKEAETLKQIRARLRSMPPFQPHEYAVLFGLLIARMLCPQKRRLSSHWSTTAIGAIPAGTFSRWMPRNRHAMLHCHSQLFYYRCLTSNVVRFDELMQHLHFSDNNDDRAKRDRAWKIRPIVDALQKTFSTGYTPGGVLSFDEGMLPSHSRFNGTRMFMKDKPHKWGTKLFLTCCPRTSYCLR
jgi:hypothetical protein